MRGSTTIGIAVVTAIVLGITALTASNQTVNPAHSSQITPVVKPFRSADGAIVTDLRCGKVYLTTAGRIENLSCTLKNNTDKRILAANVEYSIILESAGKKFTDTRLHTLDAYIHPDFYEVNKAILPGGERIVESPGPMFYEDSTVKGIEVEVNYVEFEDKTTLGDSEKAARTIADIRSGAAKYKAWLSRKYTEHGKSAEALTHLLTQNLPGPGELVVTGQEEQGARAYRTRLRRIAETRGASEIHKYLNK